MNRVTTLLLRLSVFVIGAVVLAMCIFGLPAIAKEANDFPPFVPYVYSIITGFYLSAFPFFYALYQALKLLGYIEGNNAFSDLSVNALKDIKYCALAICFLCTASMPFYYFMAELDDAPGLILIGGVFVFASFVVGVFAALLQMLLKDAIDMKSEIDLTV
jgi:hypothetical protein